MIPPGAQQLSPREAQALALVVNGARTVRSISGPLDCSPSTALLALRKLRLLGLVTWDGSKAATIRPCVEMTPIR